MIKNSSKQAGSAFIVIIIVLVIAIIGAIGFVFWQNFMSGQAHGNQTTQMPMKTQQLPKQVSTTKDTPTINTISIQELGISIVVPDSIKDLTYTYTPAGMPTRVGGSNIIVGSVNFSTTSLTNKYPDCSSEKANPLGTLTKITGIYSDGVLGPTWGGGGMTKQFSDSFLTFAGPQSVCNSNAADASSGIGIATHNSDLSTAIKEAKEL